MLAEKIQWLRRAQTKFVPDASVEAGAWGEQLALAHLEGFIKGLHASARIFPSIRVPKQQGNGKFEIDLLLVSERGILVIEVKHWGGRLTRQRGKWLQERGTEQKQLQDPVPLNEEKLQSLQRWLSRRGVSVPAAALHSLVLLTNPQVTLDPNLKAHASVLVLADLQHRVMALCGQARRWFWQKKVEPAFDFKALIQQLEQLPTWDRLQLHGGQIILGDLEYMAVPQVKASALQRKYMQKVQVVLYRSLLPGLFLKARLRVTDWAGKRQDYPLHPEAKLVFRPAGQTGKQEIAWLHVESLQLGWKDQSYYD